MPPQKGKPSIKWDTYPQMRLALMVLHDELNMKSRERVGVLNRAFPTELAACGFTNGVAEDDFDSIASQWREVCRVNNPLALLAEH